MSIYFETLFKIKLKSEDRNGMGTTCPYQRYFSVWISPTDFQVLKTSTWFWWWSLRPLPLLRLICTMFLKIKGSKWTFDSGAGLRDPHHKQKCGMDENHPYHTYPDQRVKMTHWFFIYRFHDQWSNLDHWFSSYHNDNLISLGYYVSWYQVVKMTTWSIQLVLCNLYSNNMRQ